MIKRILVGIVIVAWCIGFGAMGQLTNSLNEMFHNVSYGSNIDSNKDTK
tara:strand:+ start:3064 stop:3210 length:147 start_codon:yes stop_codon:yes gene_type:complete